MPTPLLATDWTDTMPMKTLYIKDVDIALWSQFTDACTEDGVSVSERVAECISRFMLERDKDDTRRVLMVAKVLVTSGMYTQERAERMAREMLKESK